VLDAAASAANTKTQHYCGLDPIDDRVHCDGDFWPGPASSVCHGDGLVADWAALCAPRVGESILKRAHVWCNPPYSRGSILKWCAKAEAETASDVTTAMLLSSDTSTQYFHRYALRHECRFINRRLSFRGAPHDSLGKLAPAKFGSVVLIFRPSHGLWTWR
jgi:hypothetical protein